MIFYVAIYLNISTSCCNDHYLAHIEEIRNAVRIFNESHRVHREPNVNHNPVFAMMRNGNPKPSYAFGHGFSWNEYFLASSFSYVTLQARGNLSLFGTATTNVFLGGMFDKYGIKAHVFRHGEYKSKSCVVLCCHMSPYQTTLIWLSYTLYYQNRCTKHLHR